ncbi:LysM peptidoglycan-binding domain-containing protein [Paenibacillus sp. G2S3]|uniref:LysM peptidoglycan-binding domain-containing protein n=1 Tax=Paenibacillus sp. G2S3 TaxID=3047872 RepID=UPI0024C13F18|nr:LysM peptidoglycan-binding domain-containing protein [Paenibacillus sp. G2S3]WHY18418.1 LysM peptidoglycan-binding domain-containing protein [Paenibacillus sp. G2S3]
MFDQSHGLRFDIYERIHLSEELPGIAELEEVELLPEIQVIQREDRAELYGQLLLTGLYRSEDDRTQRLEHAIPVEITVPLTRVSSIEDIGVEIENFDIDLLTMRTVNITGVLSLRGIGGAEPQPQPTWQQEEYTVAYSPLSDDRVIEASAENQEHETDALYENSQWTFGEDASEVAVEEHEHAEANADASEAPLVSSGAGHSSPIVNFSSAHEKDKGAKARTHSLDSQTEDSKAGIADYWFKAESQNEEAEAYQLNQVSQTSEADQEQEAEYTFASRETAVPAANADADQDIAVFASEKVANNELHAQEENAQPINDNTNEGLVSQETVPHAEEKQDLKIALGSKKEAEVPAKEHLTFSSLLSSSRSRKEQEALLSEGNASAAAIIPEVGNNTEWKSRFITGADGANLFRKVRLCIVQREETLDTIAEKYQLSARELGMYNRLSGQSVEEGQVLYIP